MRFHWQNLNERHGHETDLHGARINNLGPPTEGRCWFNFERPDGSRERHIMFSWHLFRRSFGAQLHLSQDEGPELTFHIAIPLLFSIWLRFGGFRPVRWLCDKLLPKEYDGFNGNDRELDVSIHNWAIWWTVWRGQMAGWSREVPRWRSGSFQVPDVLLGRMTMTKRELETRDVIIPMPERGYKARVTLVEATWKRPRWFPKRAIMADIDSKSDPIPHPGKGENSWDCGEDATYGLWTTAGSLEEAIAAMVENVMRSRRRHGGSVGWKPEAVRAAEANA